MSFFFVFRKFIQVHHILLFNVLVVRIFFGGRGYRRHSDYNNTIITFRTSYPRWIRTIVARVRTSNVTITPLSSKWCGECSHLRTREFQPVAKLSQLPHHIKKPKPDSNRSTPDSKSSMLPLHHWARAPTQNRTEVGSLQNYCSTIELQGLVVSLTSFSG